MPNGSHDTICNSSRNRTFQEVVDARLSRRGFLGGGLATAATVSLGGIGALLDAVPVSAKSRHHRDPLLGFEGIPVSSEDTVDRPARLHRQGPHRVGRSRVGRASLQAGRKQHRGRPGAAVGHAQRRRRVLSARSTGRILGPRFRQGLGARSSRPEQRVHRRRAPVSGRHRQLDAGENQRNRRTPTACRSSKSSENAAAATTTIMESLGIEDATRIATTTRASGKSSGPHDTPAASPAGRR